MFQEVPHIDLRSYHTAERDAFIQTLGQGLCTFGFLKVAGHGIDPALFESCYDLFRSFFALDEERKRAYDCVADNTRGYTPFGKERAKDSPQPDLKEFWQVGQVLPPGHPDEGLFPANVWPRELPELEATVMSLCRSLESCAATLLEALAQYFSLPADTFSQMIVHGDSVLRAIHYPPIAGTPAPHQVRAAAHEDINLMTLLPGSKGSGLEILTHDDTWLPIAGLEGDLIVDTGDMMSRITNGRVAATTHRVVNPYDGQHDIPNESRYSMPFFVHPHPRCELRVLPSFVSEDQPPRFAPITARAFLEERLQEIGLRAPSAP